MMSLWDALRMNMMISYQELVRTFPNIPVPEGMAEITNIVGGATTPVGWLAVKFGEFFSTAP